MEKQRKEVSKRLINEDFVDSNRLILEKVKKSRQM